MFPHATVQDLTNGSQTALFCQLTIDCRARQCLSACERRVVNTDKILVTFDIPKFILEENDAVTLG